MAVQEINIRANVDTAEAEENTEGLAKVLGKLSESIENLAETQKKMGQETKKSLDGASKSTNALAKGFKGVGLAIKAAGIGLVISLLNGLKEVLMQNQAIADGFSTVFETISVVFNEIVKAVSSAVSEVNKATGGFDALGKVMKGLLILALTPIKLIFKQIQSAVVSAQLAWEQSFFGDGDKTKIKELTMDLIQIKNEVVEIGKEAAQAGKSVVENFSEAVDEVSQLATASIENIKEVSITAAIETAKRNVQLRNDATLAAAQQQRLVEQYDRQAEKLRQIRDLESNSIEVRKAANEQLLQVLNDQEASMIRLADLQIASAQADVKKSNNIENQVALTEALANKEAILAQVEGFRSEQQANINGLTREEIALSETATKGDEERAQKQREFAAEQETNEALKIEKLKANLAIEYEILLADFEKKKLLYEEGTQGRADAEQEYLNKKLELDQREDKIDADSAKKKVDREKKLQAAKLGVVSSGFNTVLALAEGNAQAQKGISAAQATFDTYAAIAGQLKAFSGVPVPGYAIAQAVSTGIFGLLNVRKILSTPTSLSGSASSVSSSGSSGQVPTAQDEQIVPNIDAINQGVGGNQNSRFSNIRNYVVQEDIEDEAALNQKLNDIQAA